MSLANTAATHRDLHSFPTRRSSDLRASAASDTGSAESAVSSGQADAAAPSPDSADPVDRKSTRLNSSHVEISYAVFCLKKKNGSTWSHNIGTELHNHNRMREAIRYF